MQQIFSLHAKKKGRYKKAGPPVHEDLVRRNFTAGAPNVTWLTDITEHPTGEGQAVSVCGQGLLLQQDRRVLHRFSHAGLTRGRGVA
jgi:transposase InsO family protein